MKKCFFLSALMLSALNLFAQGEFIIELNPATGAFTKIGNPIPGIHWIYPEVRAYDEANGRMIFPGGDPTPDHLYSVDVTNGSVIANPSFPVTGTHTLGEPQFDNSTGTLFGMHHDNTTSSFYLATINPTTGAYTQVGTTPVSGLNGLSQGLSTFDEINHDYIVVSSNTIFSINAQTGITTSVALVLQTGDGLINISFNNGNDTLYGLLFDNSAQSFFLAWIDRSTGDVTSIGSGTTLANGNGSSTIDEANRRFIYCYSGQGGYHLSVMDLTDGSILFNNQITLSSLDNIHSVKFDNTANKLFAIHWDNVIETTTSLSNIGTQLTNIYPNPASEEVHIDFTKNYHDIHVSLYNAIGQQLRAIDLKQTNQFDLQLQNLSSGLYFLQFETKDERFSARFTKQ